MCPKNRSSRNRMLGVGGTGLISFERERWQALVSAVVNLQADS